MLSKLKDLVKPKRHTDHLWPCDDNFERLYDEGMLKCGLDVTNNPRKRRRKYLNVEYLNLVINNIPRDSKIAIAEAGVYKGVSSYILATNLISNGFSANNIRFDLFDSFEGLSERDENDKIERKGQSTKGLMKGALEEVKSNLSKFQFICYNKGWIPDCFDNKELNDVKYSFVSIDVDLYKPILDSLDFFYPKLLNPGVIIIDDFGSPKWPGAEKAVKEFVERTGASLIRSTLGIGIILKCG